MLAIHRKTLEFTRCLFLSVNSFFLFFHLPNRILFPKQGDTALRLVLKRFINKTATMIAECWSDFENVEVSASLLSEPRVSVPDSCFGDIACCGLWKLREYI